MKKTVLSSVFVCAMALTLGALFTSPAQAVCPVKGPCEKKIEKPASIPCYKTMTSEERAKIKEEKKAEFEERMKLTDSQKAQLDKIKAEEKKLLTPMREEMKKEQVKIEALFEKEKAVRVESMKKFEAMLTPEQKEEMEKIKAEIKCEMEKMAPSHEGMRAMPPKLDGKPMPPKCGCPCHKEHVRK